MIIFNCNWFIMKRFIFLIQVVCISHLLPGQNISTAYYSLIQTADSLYNAHDFMRSGLKYSEAFKVNGWKGTSNDRYNAACSYALASMPDSAFFQLDRIVTLMNYKNYAYITTDPDLIPLHNDARWEPLLEGVRKNKERAEANLNILLAAKLDSVYSDDQNYRQQIYAVEQKYGGDSREIHELINLIAKKDSMNIMVVTSILDQYGWLGADVVSDNGNLALFLVIQHADLATQQKYLPMMREAVKNGRAQGSSLALLEDRVALREGKRQIYGSQIGQDPDTRQYFVSPLDDPDHVDERRASVGLEPLAVYVSRWQIQWDVAQYKKDLPALEEKLHHR